MASSFNGRTPALRAEDGSSILPGVIQKGFIMTPREAMLFGLISFSSYAWAAASLSVDKAFPFGPQAFERWIKLHKLSFRNYFVYRVIRHVGSILIGVLSPAISFLAIILFAFSLVLGFIFSCFVAVFDLLSGSFASLRTDRDAYEKEKRARLEKLAEKNLRITQQAGQLSEAEIAGGELSELEL